MPEKMVARMTEINVKIALPSASLLRPEKVLGKEQAKHMTAAMMLNTTVHCECPVMVFSHFAVTKTWRPWMNVLFRMNIVAVAYHAHVFPQKSIWPMSHTSLTSGWRRQNSQRTRDVYKTIPAINTVKMRPGTRPRIE